MMLLVCLYSTIHGADKAHHMSSISQKCSSLRYKREQHKSIIDAGGSTPGGGFCHVALVDGQAGGGMNSQLCLTVGY